MNTKEFNDAMSVLLEMSPPETPWSQASETIADILGEGWVARPHGRHKNPYSLVVNDEKKVAVHILAGVPESLLRARMRETLKRIAEKRLPDGFTMVVVLMTSRAKTAISRQWLEGLPYSWFSMLEGEEHLADPAGAEVLSKLSAWRHQDSVSRADVLAYFYKSREAACTARKMVIALSLLSLLRVRPIKLDDLLEIKKFNGVTRTTLRSISVTLENMGVYRMKKRIGLIILHPKLILDAICGPQWKRVPSIMRLLGLERECLTPGAVYHTQVSSDLCAVIVNFNRNLDIDEKTAMKIQDQLHDSIEEILAPLWRAK